MGQNKTTWKPPRQAAAFPPAENDRPREPARVPALDFHLPPHLEAGEPPEARGLSRDQVRLMVTYLTGGSQPGSFRAAHTEFRRLPDFLVPGDLLVINTSGTRSAALIARRADGAELELHLSTRLPAGLWVVELRQPGPDGTLPFYAAQPGERLDLPAGGQVTLLTPYRADLRGAGAVDSTGRHSWRRLWIADLQLPEALDPYLEKHGFPIRYKYVRDAWPNTYYQTVYATEPGSAEMPSAGRAFTPELITRLVAQGVQAAPLVLHTGVASLENHEPPYEEYYRVPVETAAQVNAARRAGRRVIAVGTTVVRAIETVTGPDRLAHPGEGWTSLVITPRRGLYAVDGLLTGFHEPRSSHLAMLEALAGADHLRHAYQQALEKGYLWHEFGDLHLMLPG